jgi:hypothetical protein
MTGPQNNQEWQNLLAELRKLTALIGPLEAIVAQEAQPGISDRLTELMTELSRIGDAIHMAAQAMEKSAQSTDLLQKLMQHNQAQARYLREMRSEIGDILWILGAPPKKAQAEKPGPK